MFVLLFKAYRVENANFVKNPFENVMLKRVPRSLRRIRIGFRQFVINKITKIFHRQGKTRYLSAPPDCTVRMVCPVQSSFEFINGHL